MFKLRTALIPWGRLVQQNRFNCFTPGLMTTHQAELTIKATRRQFLKKTVLNQNKLVLHAEIRQPTDFVIALRKAGKCPGVIIPYSKNKSEEVDIVLPGKAMRTRTKSQQYGLERVHMRVEGKDYHCVLKEVRMNVKNFIEKVYFKEYMPGEPNHLKIPLHFSHLEDNRFFHQGYEYDMKIDFVEIVCYNHEYPTMFYIDVSYVNLDRPYTLGDLANTFPPGLILASSVNPKKIVFQVTKPESGLLTNDTSLEDIMENVNFGKNMEKDKNKGAAATPAATTATPATGAKKTK